MIGFIRRILGYPAQKTHDIPDQKPQDLTSHPLIAMWDTSNLRRPKQKAVEVPQPPIRAERAGGHIYIYKDYAGGGAPSTTSKPSTSAKTRARERADSPRPDTNDSASPHHPLNPLNMLNPISPIWYPAASDHGTRGGGGGHDYGAPAADSGGSDGGSGCDITPDPRFDMPRRTLAF